MKICKVLEQCLHMIHAIYGIAFIIVIAPWVISIAPQWFLGRMAGFVIRWRIPWYPWGVGLRIVRAVLFMIPQRATGHLYRSLYVFTPMWTDCSSLITKEATSTACFRVEAAGHPCLTLTGKLDVALVSSHIHTCWYPHWLKTSVLCSSLILLLC